MRFSFRNFFFSPEVIKGKIYEGSATDSDYAGNNRTELALKSEMDVNDDVTTDVNITAGYEFNLIGYSNRKQELGSYSSFDMALNRWRNNCVFGFTVHRRRKEEKMRLEKIALICLFVLFWFVPAGFAQQDAANSSDLFIGGNLGVGFLTGASDDTDIETTGFLYGVTGRYFFNRFGIGGTYNVSHYDSDNDSAVEIESDISTATFDVMYDFSQKENYRFYIHGSIGRGKEEASGDWDTEITSDLIGIGIGGYDKTNKFSFGWNLRYLTASDSANADGIVEVCGTLGFSSADL